MPHAPCGRGRPSLSLSSSLALHPPRSELVRTPPPLMARPSSLLPLLLPPPTSLPPTSSHTSFPLPRLAFRAPHRGRSPPFPPLYLDRAARSHQRKWSCCHQASQAIGRALAGAPDSRQATTPLPHRWRAAGRPSPSSSPDLGSLE